MSEESKNTHLSLIASRYQTKGATVAAVAGQWVLILPADARRWSVRFFASAAAPQLGVIPGNMKGLPVAAWFGASDFEFHFRDYPDAVIGDWYVSNVGGGLCYAMETLYLGR
jgi:hypothetical protein